MGDKDLESIISGIGNDQDAIAQKQAEVDRLKSMIKKQKQQITEQEGIIEELQSRVNNMYDLPADVEALKRMIGEQRSEINAKDQNLEMMNGRIAELEAELKGANSQIEPLSKNLDTYISQLGELKAKLSEQSSTIKFKDQTINELNMKLTSMDENYKKVESQYSDSVSGTMSQLSVLKNELAEKDAKLNHLSLDVQDKEAIISKERQTVEEMRKQVSDLQDKLQEREMDSGNVRSQIEAELKEKLFSTKTEMTEQISEQKSKLLDTELELKESKHAKEAAEKEANEITAKYQELVAKYDNIVSEKSMIQDQIDDLNKTIEELKEFKEKNINVSIVLEGLTKLFKQEPLFKTFNLVRDVGEMNIDDLRNALGVPSVTTKKYIKQFVEVGLFTINEETGKIKLMYKLPKVVND